MTAHSPNSVNVDQLLTMYTEQFSEKLERIQAELTFACRLCAAHPERAAGWQARINKAVRLLDDGLAHGIQGGQAVDVAALTAEAEALLAPLSDVAKSYTLLCVGHAHIDMNWQWSWPETVGLTHDTFQTMLTLMDEFPQFIFSQSQASVYAAIEKYNPAMFKQIQQRVAEGRWEVTASQWVEGDTNLANGESISRHLLYSRAYFRDKFGLSAEDVPIDFEPDTFGHPATLPTILTRGGVRYYYHCRGSRGPHLYWWIGPDGSRLLVLNDIQWYMHFDASRRHVAVAPNVADPLMDFAQATGLRVMPVLYGVGDHGGGPTRSDLGKILEMDAWPVYPHLAFSTLRRFFEQAEREARDLPEILPVNSTGGERNFVFAGCYTSQARQKEANRHGENLLYAAEVAATLGRRLADVPYPHQNLEEAWRYLLFDQFHDILPGSGVRATRHYTLGHAQDTQAGAGMARTNALRALSSRVNTATLREGFAEGGALRAYKDEREAGIAMGAGVGNATATGGESAFSMTRGSDRAYLIFNPLTHARTEVVRVKLWDTKLDPSLLVATSEGLAPQPVQVLGTGHYAGHHFLEVAFPVEAPPLGYRAVCVSDRRMELGLPAPEAPSLWDGTGGALRTREPRDHTLENEFLALQVDPASGSIVSLIDKRSGRELVPPEEHLGVLQYCLEAYEGMSAWVIGQFKRREDLLEGGELTQVHAGPHLQTFRWTRLLGETRLELDISVAQGVPRVDFRLRVDWREVGDRETGIPHLKVRFPLNLETPIARYEIPFGSIRRDLFDGEEVPAQRWVDLSDEEGRGVTLVNTSKYGFNVEAGARDTPSLNMTLLRASIDPDPLPDLGDHAIPYALVPHGEDWAEGDMTQAGENFNVPLIVMSCDFHRGDLPPVHSFVSVAPNNVRLAALKEAEDGEGIVLRVVEVEGKTGEAEIRLAPELLSDHATAVEVDTLERALEINTARLDADGEGWSLTLPLPGFGIKTVLVRSSRDR
ncbi:MAG: alpha-mannosidase [Anaerolineae bacterium]